ncbi:hypothetical protein BDN72DRAFT_688006 [Pluteus cervinus]|uniref:Uncharacterized protein n=1 Tax=Pluteus cervinus TaxID=181527 RepID=A0ACD3AR68_9AGAR|nr:hypothetical protein BDN72DRAFT_688006 [Pluteus cervinus]
MHDLDDITSFGLQCHLIEAVLQVRRFGLSSSREDLSFDIQHTSWGHNTPMRLTTRELAGFGSIEGWATSFALKSTRRAEFGARNAGYSCCLPVFGPRPSMLPSSPTELRTVCVEISIPGPPPSSPLTRRNPLPVVICDQYAQEHSDISSGVTRRCSAPVDSKAGPLLLPPLKSAELPVYRLTLPLLGCSVS